MSGSAEITKELARGKFTDEMLTEMRGKIGTELRTDGCVNNEFADRMAITRFCEGIGDDNPLWVEQDYAAHSVHGGLVAPPSFIFACLASVQFGWPGLGGNIIRTGTLRPDRASAKAPGKQDPEPHPPRWHSAPAGGGP